MNIDTVVDEIIEHVRDDRSLTHDMPALLRVLANYPDLEPAAIAARAREIWKGAISAGDMDRAQGSALIANIVYAAAGDEPNSIRAAYDFGQTRFMLANDVEAYASQRQQMITLCGRASELGMDDIAFNAAVSVSDCTFFAAECEPDPQRRDAMLYSVIGDVLSTCNVLRARKDKPATSSLHFQRFVSLATSAFSNIRQRLESMPLPFFAGEQGGYDEELTTRMRALAAALEEFVPDNFVCGENAEKAARVSQALADLSKDSGSEARARSRLRALLLNG